MFIDEMKKNEMVESVIQIGSRDSDVDSDVDLVLVLYEEANISSFISKLVQKYQLIEISSQNHIFIRDETHIYDLYIVSSAFMHAFYSQGIVLSDNRGFISKLLGDEKVVNIDDHIYAMCLLAKRIICKLKKKKFVQAVRLLGDIRDKHLICVYQTKKFISSDSIINITWNFEEDIYRDCYLKTFCPPIYDQIVEAVASLVCVLQKLTDASNTVMQKEIENVTKKLYG